MEMFVWVLIAFNLVGVFFALIVVMTMGNCKLWTRLVVGVLIVVVFNFFSLPVM